jgi:small subunit ribosomal protein S8
MSFNDTIAELLTKIRNAKDAEHRFVDNRLTNMNQEIVRILKEKGFISNYLVSQQRRKIRIFLKYNKTRASIIQGLKRISKPGLRKYVSHDEIPYVYGGIGIAILSTSSGIMDDHTAREKKVGGELLCYVW